MINSKFNNSIYYYESLAFKYDLGNSVYRKVKASTKDKLFQQVYLIIFKCLKETITFAEEQYGQEVEEFWKGAGEYYLVITPSYFGIDVSICIEKL